MKKLFVAMLLSTASAGAFAYDTQVNFDGEVTDQTCQISGPGGLGGSINVALDTIGVSALTTVGSWAGNKKFTIQLTNCTAATTTVKWEQMVNVDATTGALKNTAAGGSNALIRVLNDDQTPVNMAADTGRTFTTAAADLDYYAQYYASVVPVTAGLVSTFGYVTLTY
ncbi:fimbrial protein [Pseudomonas sp. Irchel s3a18]|uniref:fimbrial protein n=1 Tax=Pseudomonas sp. Irchel s3a18 TaxID=2009053 RepID=UPI000BA357E8|nr:fimbrial protein [Pseudomonas sp. Irchel s3a18]